MRAVNAIEMMRVGSWRDDDVPGAVAEALGLSVARERLHSRPTGGESPLRALDAVATRIASGETGVTLIAGAEANGPGAAGGRRAYGARPPRGSRIRVSSKACGRRSKWASSRALDFFPLYEHALRAHEGASLADGQAESARMWAEMSLVAADNPYAWSRAGGERGGAARRRARQPHGRRSRIRSRSPPTRS